MDNRLLNINGNGNEMLLKTLELAFLQCDKKCVCSGWQQTKKDGLILCWLANENGIHPMPADLTASDCLPFVTQWLKGNFANTVELSEWCENTSHDGHNKLGWQVYCGDWGHVGEYRNAICAVKPAYLWYGK